MPIITIEAGKLSREQKKELIKDFTEKITEVTKVPKQFTTVIIKENEDDNMGVGGETITDIKNNR